MIAATLLIIGTLLGLWFTIWAGGWLFVHFIFGLEYLRGRNHYKDWGNWQ